MLLYLMGNAQQALIYDTAKFEINRIAVQPTLFNALRKGTYIAGAALGQPNLDLRVQPFITQYAFALEGRGFVYVEDGIYNTMYWHDGVCYEICCGTNQATYSTMKGSRPFGGIGSADTLFTIPSGKGLSIVRADMSVQTVPHQYFKKECGEKMLLREFKQRFSGYPCIRANMRTLQDVFVGR